MANNRVIYVWELGERVGVAMPEMKIKVFTEEKCMKKNTTKQYLFAACSADDGLPIAIEPTVRALSERFEVPENTFRSCIEKKSVSKKANVFVFRIPNPFYEAKAVM